MGDLAVMLQNPNTAAPLAGPLWTTPRRLQAALAALWLAVLLFLMAALSGAHQHRQALQTIGRDAAPSIIGAQRIKAGLSDMDAAAADVLLLPPGVTQEQADDHYEASRVEVTENLTRAAQNVNFGEAERRPLRTLADALGIYEADVAQARLLHLRGELGSRLVYRMTHSEIHDTLLSAADALNQANNAVLEAAYRHQQNSARISLTLLWLSGLLVIALLVAAQIGLSRLTRRTFNLPLLGATALALTLLLYTSSVFSKAGSTLLTVKEEAFSSISTLWQIRAIAFDANSEESRWLMDTPQAPQYEQLFFAQSGQIATLPVGQSYETVLAGLDQGTLPEDFHGGIADKLRTLHFPGEKDAAREMLRTFGVYDGTDRQMRTLENSGRHDAAVDYCVGLQPGQHGWAFGQFNTALDRTLTIDQQAFDTAVAGGVHEQSGYDVLATLILLAAAMLIGAGMRTRLREYAL
ncbi:MAG: hypothetical protein ACRYFS_21085 [Janthinobacterium lividum]